LVALVDSLAAFIMLSLAASRSAVPMRTSTPLMVERSAAIPFLKKPPALDGSMAGDVGFDPLGFSTTITELGGDLNYVREAELMHGRQAMLATVGFIWPSTFGKIIAADVPLDPLAAQYSLPVEVFAQVAVAIGIAEGLRAQLIYKGTQVPGEHFDDELKGKLIKFFQLETPEAMMAMKTKEIKHCRLAMIAVVGMFAQDAITGSLYPFF